MEGLGRERERVLAENQKAIVTDIRNAGLRVLRDHDAGRDIGTAVLGAVVGIGKRAMSIASPSISTSWQGAAGGRAGRSAGRGRAAPFAGWSSRRPRTPAGPCCGSNRRRRPAEVGAVVVEHEARALPSLALLHGLADVAQGHGRSTSTNSPCWRSTSRNWRKSA